MRGFIGFRAESVEPDEPVEPKGNRADQKAKKRADAQKRQLLGRRLGDLTGGIGGQLTGLLLGSSDLIGCLRQWLGCLLQLLCHLRGRRLDTFGDFFGHRVDFALFFGKGIRLLGGQAVELRRLIGGSSDLALAGRESRR